MTTTNEKNYAARQFADTWARIDLEVPFQEDWHNGTGYFDHAVDYKPSALPDDYSAYGKRWKSIDPNGRKIIGVKTPFGNVVVFERYSNIDHELNQRIVSNAPEELTGVVRSPLTSSEMVQSILGFFDFDNNIGSIFAAYVTHAASEAARAHRSRTLAEIIDDNQTAPQRELERMEQLPFSARLTEEQVDAKVAELTSYTWDALGNLPESKYDLTSDSSMPVGENPYNGDELLEVFKDYVLELAQTKFKVRDAHINNQTCTIDGVGLYLGLDNLVHLVPLFTKTVFSINPLRDGTIQTASVGGVVKVIGQETPKIVSYYDDSVDMTEVRPNGHYFLAYAIFKK